MKALTRNLWITAALGGTLLLWSCSETPADQAEDTNDQMQKIADDARDDAATMLEWENERNAILADLRSLRDEIDKELGKTNEELAKKDLKADDRTKHEAMKAELEKEKDLVDGTITNLEGATPETREAVRAEAEQTRSEVKTWWEKRKEVQDQHTDADYDKDGH
jgi:hypothetical protein